jgi:hypothetical protein
MGIGGSFPEDKVTGGVKLTSPIRFYSVVLVMRLNEVRELEVGHAVA